MQSGGGRRRSAEGAEGGVGHRRAAEGGGKRRRAAKGGGGRRRAAEGYMLQAGIVCMFFVYLSSNSL